MQRCDIFVQVLVPASISVKLKTFSVYTNCLSLLHKTYNFIKALMFIVKSEKNIIMVSMCVHPSFTVQLTGKRKNAFVSRCVIECSELLRFTLHIVCVLWNSWVGNWHIMVTHAVLGWLANSRVIVVVSVFITVHEGEVGAETDLNLPQNLEIGILSKTKTTFSHLSDCRTTIQPWKSY